MKKENLFLFFRLNKNTLIWISFLASNLLSLAGLMIVHHNRTLGDAILLSSLLFLLFFWIFSFSEIITSEHNSIAEKISWPALIIVLSILGQIAYMIRRRKLNSR